ncbi:molybdenum cofactor synthesis domain-containing protein [Dethiosulfatibacter aminovorans DSM 17477]|uniref:Molybdenum cofactor synthesis domain-containing protein n=1 Tax=Dethiosulfatibacter aminovorans DSM 17477 TaxID=1121476 RepID=A0A1M6C2Y0_9FIRM|nr:molybdopterin-binding protein [Dethiosulfatibacter aminovorans]SHI55171.1 molybdenum cofactor synthesis domain-containing protein [Dethiosulfatibacter aminovorans DSM 17477]
MGLNLLEKTELWINNITLDNANLTRMAGILAEVLKLDKEKVLVVDVRSNHITFDIMEKNVEQENIIGKESEILEKLGAMDGVNLYDDTYIHSNGILGTICYDQDNAPEIIENINTMEKEITERISKRAIVYPTGFELKEGLIEDTNTPFLKELLENEGYKVTIGKIIDDDLDIASYHLSDALSRGFGLIITTGGVGAEDKDKSVEALLRVDKEAAVDYIVKFQKGTGRHVKDGVRIGVGQVGLSRIVTLPGPNDEVRLAAPVLLECLNNNSDKTVTSRKLSEVLAKKLMAKKHMHHKHHTHDWK